MQQPVETNILRLFSVSFTRITSSLGTRSSFQGVTGSRHHVFLLWGNFNHPIPHLSNFLVTHYITFLPLDQCIVFWFGYISTSVLISHSVLGRKKIMMTKKCKCIYPSHNSHRVSKPGLIWCFMVSGTPVPSMCLFSCSFF